MSFQRLLYMCTVENYAEANQFFGDLYGQPATGHMDINASLTGEMPKTHSVGSAQFTEEQLPEVLDWFSQPGYGVVYVGLDDYLWGVAFNEWGLRYVEEPL